MPTSLVTGGTGFIALHVVKILLDNGHAVHTTVRSLRNVAKCQPLFDLQSQYPGRLSLFEADLLHEGSFGPAMQVCDTVYHIASPFLVPQQIKNGRKECVEPALQGTRNVLESVEKCPSVKRVVLTSSIAAMYGDCSEIPRTQNGALTETYWNNTSSETNNPYHYAKVVAEREAWRLHDAQSRWELVVLNPGLTLGPPLTGASTSGSLFMIENIFSGANKMGCPELYYPIVDVRDVAEAHVRAGSQSFSPAPSSGSGPRCRYLLTAGDRTLSLLEMADILRPSHRDPRLLPTRNLPRLMVYIAGPFIGVSRHWIAHNLGVRFRVDNRRSVKELGVVYRPVEQTLKDQYEAWLRLKHGE
ncbi:NAD(P)-binding protein [Aspergillus saccharolyticus JOP 1030-1]|uniref:NAD(P)-binding protein n=1 Tax=Aspergillus saccharolyticus JOP 1030-1 TaxID=1450539 RepID=A0A318ZUX5_9EURO|nr:NAD(P)-binding protein [Aspergillus saccharolyticus JOP 1030-1]PYH43908.1 NAD(P)-binding protein [Aspergillus saccharolyticus JOP 1030-1]